MKKISVISVVLNNFKNDSRVLKENLSLKHAGYQVQVVALHEKSLKECEDIHGVPVHRIKLKSKYWSKNKIIQLLKYFEFISRVIYKYRDSDIIHCNDLNTLPIGVIIKKVLRKNIKIVYDAHEYEINDTPNESNISIKIKYYIEKICIQYVDAVITVSNSISNEYVNLYNIKKPALVLNTPPYIEIEKQNIFRKTFNIGIDKTIFLYQGSLAQGRGIEILLKTFEQLDNKNIIIFMGYGVLEETIMTISKQSSNIYFHHAVSPDVLLEFTSSADFGIATIEDSCLSYHYCLPNKIFEYAMANVPVLVSNLPEMKKIVMQYKIGVVTKENNIQGLKDAILQATKLDTKTLLENIQIVKKVYNWNEQEKILLEVYRDINEN